MYDVLKFIHEHIQEDLVLADVATKFGYSKWHFSTKFHEYTGKTFGRYIRHFRLQMAALEIMERRKLTDIAMRYGYDSIGGFNKAFCSEFGCYPSEYRKNAKNALSYYERRKLSMCQLTNRCELLRDIILGENDYEELYGVQYRVYTKIGQGNALQENRPMLDVVAEGMSCILERAAPVIIPGELFVGVNHNDAKHYRDEITLEDMRNNRISEEDIARYLELSDFDPYKLLHANGYTPTQKEQDADAEWAAFGGCTASNHYVPGYEEFLKLGFTGLLEKISHFEQLNGPSTFYNATKRICIAACQLGEKYAAAAERLKAEKDPAYNEADLDRIIAVCRRVPAYPATNLHEAIQSLLFAHIINTWEDHINANSLGRLDQILYPYYKADIESGRITKEEAFELLCCLWLKLYRSYDVQQSCVGGTAPDGSSQVNELSYMMLDVTEQLNFVRCLSVRYSQNTEKAFMKRALEVVGHLQKGIPFFFNDDVMIPALESKGISHEDACNYTQVGCVETVIPGKSNPHAVTGLINMLKALEYTFCNGYSMMHPHMQNGCETGPLEQLNTFEAFYKAVLQQVYSLLDFCCGSVVNKIPYVAKHQPRPYKALLTEGCLETNRDFNDNGAIYNYYQIALGGVPNLADSLEVIRKFVYQEQKYTLAELKEILENNFPDEAVRQEFIHKAAKFGNDIDSVDALAVDLVDKACDYLDELSDKYGVPFHAQPFTFLWMINKGQESAASPDGRRKGEVLAYSVSPMQGRDFNGLSAMLNSISKFPTKRTPGTTSAIVEIDPKLFTDRNISTLTDILMAASAKGLCNVQFNVVSADTLIDAKKHPEKYNNLAVRVSGFSQKFNLLSPEVQDHIIARTKHTCL